MGKKRWWGQELLKLRVDYESRKLSVIEVAKKHRTSLGTVARLARQHGWTSRREWVNPQKPTLQALKLRKAFLIKRREDDLRDLESIEHKINHLVAFGDA